MLGWRNLRLLNASKPVIFQPAISNFLIAQSSNFEFSNLSILPLELDFTKYLSENGSTQA